MTSYENLFVSKEKTSELQNLIKRGLFSHSLLGLLGSLCVC